MKNVLFLFACLLFLTTCKKYHDGGYHFNALKHLEGRWGLKLYEVDGIDSTILTKGANTIPNYTEDFANFSILHGGKRAEIRLTNHYRSYAVSFNNKTRDVLGLREDSSLDAMGCLSTNSQMCQQNIFNPRNEQTFSWKIDKLTKEELILVSRSYNYRLILVK